MFVNEWMTYLQSGDYLPGLSQAQAVVFVFGLRSSRLPDGGAEIVDSAIQSASIFRSTEIPTPMTESVTLLTAWRDVTRLHLFLMQYVTRSKIPLFNNPEGHVKRHLWQDFNGSIVRDY